jgi:hypothetical protein
MKNRAWNFVSLLLGIAIDIDIEKHVRKKKLRMEPYTPWSWTMYHGWKRVVDLL